MAILTNYIKKNAFRNNKIEISGNFNKIQYTELRYKESQLSRLIGTKADPVHGKSRKLDNLKKRLWECCLGNFLADFF